MRSARSSDSKSSKKIEAPLVCLFVVICTASIGFYSFAPGQALKIIIISIVTLSVIPIILILRRWKALFPWEQALLLVSSSNLIFPIYLKVPEPVLFYVLTLVVLILYALLSKPFPFVLGGGYLILVNAYIILMVNGWSIKGEFAILSLAYVSLSILSIKGGREIALLRRRDKPENMTKGGDPRDFLENLEITESSKVSGPGPIDWKNDFNEEISNGLVRGMLERVRSITRAEMVCLLIPKSSSGMRWKVTEVSKEIGIAWEYRAEVGGGWEPVKVPFLLSREFEVTGDKIEAIYDSFNEEALPEYIFSCPVFVDGSPRAVLYIEKHFPGKPEAVEKDAIAMAADFISRIIKTMSYFEELGKDIRKFMYISGFIREVANAKDVGQIFDSTARKISEFFNAPYVLVQLYNVPVKGGGYMGMKAEDEWKGIESLAGSKKLEGTIIKWCMDKGVRRILDYREKSTVKVAPLPPLILEKARERPVMVFPFRVKGENDEDMDGVAIVIGEREAFFSSGDLENIEVIMSVAEMSLPRVFDYHHVKGESSKDPLTGLYNRRFLGERMNELFSHVTRKKRVMSFMLLDIDHFKNLNDSYGHSFGDEVLTVLARIMHGIIRPYDTLARYGGEEFAIILPETGTKGALKIAERIRIAVKNKKFDFNRSEVRVTVSIGIATYPEDGTVMEELVDLADKALYNAKNSGRDRISTVSDLI